MPISKEERLAKRKAKRESRKKDREAKRKARLAAKGVADTKDDSLCTQCGICCYLYLPGENGRLFYTPFLCGNLNQVTKLCAVFDQRLKVFKPCNTAERGVRRKVMPVGCPYTAGVKDYVGPAPDYNASPAVKARVDKILADGPNEHGQYVINGDAYVLDTNWTPTTCVYPT